MGDMDKKYDSFNQWNDSRRYSQTTGLGSIRAGKRGLETMGDMAQRHRVSSVLTFELFALL